MKNIKFIAVVALLTLFSCEKENIRPFGAGCDRDNFDEINKSLIFSNETIDGESIIKDVVSRGTGKNDAGSPIVTDSTGLEGLPGFDLEGDITDPNNEPDVSKRKGKK